MTQRSISGAILPQDLRAGTWLLRADPPGGAAVYLRSVGPDGSELLSDRRITRIDIEWRAQDVVVSVIGASGVRYFKCGGAVLHEPQMQLYSALPLAQFDAKAQRFWRRIFRLLRIPGGRIVLRWIARRRRAGPHSAA